MTMDGSSSSIHDLQEGLGKTYAAANVRRWKSSSRSFPGVFLNIPDLNMSFVRQTTDV